MIPSRFFLIPCLWVASLCLSACLLGPEYNRADLRRDGAGGKAIWRGEHHDDVPAPPIDADWWKAFGDPLLDSFAEKALTGNPDLEVRLLRIQEADLQLRQSGTRRFPQVNQSGNASYYWRRQEIANDPFYDPEDDFEERLEESTTKVSDSEYYNLGLSLNWELDIWGKQKRNRLGARAGYAESHAQLAGERLRLIGEIAKTVFDIRKQDREERIVQQLCADAERRLAAFRAQYAEGLMPEWRMLRQRVEVDRLFQEIAGIAAERQRLEHRLALLTGQNPGNVSIPNTADDELPTPATVPSGLPSDLLSRRPDLVAAEYRVEKAVHRIGETLAARFPTIALTGQAGLANTALPDLLKQWTLGLTPSLSFPIFDGGAQKLRVASTEIQAQIARIEYRNAVLKAFEEVENLLADMESRREALETARSKRDAMRRIRKETEEKFQEGLVSQLELMDAERELLSAEREVLRVRRSGLDDAVSLAKAMGGGWSDAVLLSDAVASTSGDASAADAMDSVPRHPDTEREIAATGTGASIRLRSLVLDRENQVGNDPGEESSGRESEGA
jgi:NodT family efflux transporter outer membrane factor (OMF) lipoprotein